MVEQLCYTRSAIGLSGSTEFQVRAASNGVADSNSARFAAFDRYLRYTLPAGSDRSRSTTDTSPWCLAYADAGNERIIVHKVYTGRDAQGRPGVYFAHLLAELPEGFSVRDAIDMWKSSFWLLSETQSPLDPRSVKLPSVSPHQLERGSRASYDLSVFPKYLPFVIQAFLTLKDSQKLYITAPDTQTATLIWGLTRSLPLPMLKSLTFSTYEHDLNDASMRIVGTCRPSTAERGSAPSRQDWPADFYSGRGPFLNCYTGECSGLEMQLSPQLQDELNEYIQFAIQYLVSGEQRTPLRDMIGLADESGIDKIEPLLSLYKDFRDRELTPEDVTNVLRQFKLAILRLKFRRIQDKVINLAITDQQWWETSGKEAITNLYQHYRLNPEKDAKDTLSELNERIAGETCIAILESNKKDSYALIQLMDAVVPANVEPLPWVKLLDMIYKTGPSWNPSKLYKEWSERELFLQRWAHGVEYIPIEQIIPWLQDISWGEDLEALLSGNLPHIWKLQVIVPLITSSASIPQFAVKIVTHHAHAFNSVLKFLMEEGSRQQQALNFFAWMVKYGYEDKIEMLAILLLTEASRLDTDDVLHKAALSPEEKLLFFTSYGTTLFTKKNIGKSRYVLEMVRSSMQSFTLIQCKQRESRDLLELIGQRLFDALDNETRQRLLSWRNVGAIFTQKHQEGHFYQADNRYFHELGRAIQMLQLGTQKEFPEFKDRLFNRLVNTRWNQEELHETITDLSPSLIPLRPKEAHKAGSILLYQLAKFMGRYVPTFDILVPYITLSITYAVDLKCITKDELVILLETLLKGIDRETFDALEREARSWPDPIRKEWRYGASLAPTTPGERVVGVAKGAGNAVANVTKGACNVVVSFAKGAGGVVKGIRQGFSEPSQSKREEAEQLGVLHPRQSILSTDLQGGELSPRERGELMYQQRNANPYERQAGVGGQQEDAKPRGRQAELANQQGLVYPPREQAELAHQQENANPYGKQVERPDQQETTYPPTQSGVSSVPVVPSPNVQQVSLDMSGNSILQPVNQEWVNKVAEVKKFYVDYQYEIISARIADLAQKVDRSPSEKKQEQFLNKEDEKITLLKRIKNDDAQWERIIREDIWINQLIDYYVPYKQSMSLEWAQ